MTISRMVGLLVALVLVGIAVVWMRVDQARHAHAIQALQFKQTELRRAYWTQEMERERLVAPRVIRDRLEQLGLMASRESQEGQ